MQSESFSRMTRLDPASYSKKAFCLETTYYTVISKVILKPMSWQDPNVLCFIRRGGGRPLCTPAPGAFEFAKLEGGRIQPTIMQKGDVRCCTAFHHF